MIEKYAVIKKIAFIVIVLFLMLLGLLVVA